MSCEWLAKHKSKNSNLNLWQYQAILNIMLKPRCLASNKVGIKGCVPFPDVVRLLSVTKGLITPSLNGLIRSTAFLSILNNYYLYSK